MTKLFLGGIPLTTTEDDIIDRFSAYGTVRDAVSMRERGFGFVTFEDRSGADAALMATHSIKGATITVKEAVGKGGGKKGKDGGGGGEVGAGQTNKIFIGGLPQDCAEEKVQAYFQAYGAITDCVVMKDRETGRTRGFGFVQFDTTEAVEKVMAQYKEHQVEGKWVEVKRSVPKDQMDRAAGGGGGGKGYGGNAYGGNSYGPAPGAYAAAPAYGGGGCGGPAYPGYPGGGVGGCYGDPSGYGAPPPAYGGGYGAPPPAYGGYAQAPPPGYAGGYNPYGGPPAAYSPGPPPGPGAYGGGAMPGYDPYGGKGGRPAPY